MFTKTQPYVNFHKNHFFYSRIFFSEICIGLGEDEDGGADSYNYVQNESRVTGMGIRFQLKQ